MLQNWFILLPELSILAFFLFAWPTNILRREKTAKTFFTLAQFFLLITICCSVLFYNKSVFPDHWQNTPLSTLFKTSAYLLTWAWFYLSSKWFLSKNRPSFRFYTVCFVVLLGFDTIASAASLLTLGLAFPIICLGYYNLILCHPDIDQVRYPANIYARSASFFCLLLWCGIAVIYQTTDSLSYAAIASFFAETPMTPPLIFLAVTLILAAFIFIMSMVPFHVWLISFISAGILPVCGFIILIPPLIYICALINLIRNCLPAFIDFVSPLLAIFAGLSLLLAALSANRENNLRRLFGFIAIYCQSFALIGLNTFSGNDISAVFAYIVIAVLSLTGVYTVFLGLKSRGEYQSEQCAVTGFAEVRPYMAAAFLVFMFSLIGLAPTLGFFGNLSVIGNLVETASWGKAILLLAGLLLVTAACLQVIRTIYFEPVSNKFDRTDKAIYICLFINMIIILLALINPAWLLHDALIILGALS